MPLMHGRSAKAFSKNVGTEMEAGKPRDQALAIAYSVKRHAMKKKMARGGMVDNEMLDPYNESEPMSESAMMVHKQMHLDDEARDHEVYDRAREPKRSYSKPDIRPMGNEVEISPEAQGALYSKGGMVGGAKELAMKILRSKKGYADGGVIEGDKYDNDFPEMGAADHEDHELSDYSIDNMGVDEHPDNDFLSDEEQTPFFHMNEMDNFDPKEHRKKILDKIMRGAR